MLLQIISYIGIFVFAITGTLKARTHKMDIFGAAVLAFATAYGGGTLRDVLIGIHPVNWMNDYLALALVVVAVIMVYLFKKNITHFKRSIFFTDAVGLGLFTAAGIETALLHQINEVYAIIMGVISATFGGLLADILCNQMPNLLKRGELYATACMAGGVVYIAMLKLNLEKNYSLTACVLLIIIIRIISKRKRLMLPDI
jgi:uncharacterized membrane protein YeiH